MRNLVDERGHLSGYALSAFKAGTLTKAELFALSEHVSVCHTCACNLAGCFDDAELLKTPPGFRDDLATKLRPAGEDKKQLLFFSFRVAVAACMTLILIFSGSLNFIANLESKVKSSDVRMLSVADDLNTGFQTFSKKLLNLEVFSHESKEK